ncbi:MAG: Alkaline phosphatase synthesis sensor protein PhoR [Chloroflexi bacterium ADurb.Bin325]|nr:MAG: Alkaline phosphatase synthesis sensor protein PhoR [Chloroflexi bacterium ADurb.Bin325]
MLLAAAVTASLVAALDRRAHTLAARNQEAEAQAAAMHQLNTQLRAANTDIAHHRAHLDTAYKELQAAYDRQQVRSAHMSELNEQLRSANAECRRRHEELERLNAELTLANARLREMEDMRARFTLMVTHELRAPVAAIQSYLKLILEGYVPPEKVNETLEKAERRAVEQLAFIADLLELGRISSADARGQARPLQIEQLLREQLDLHAAAAQERGITVHTAIAPDLPAVLANPEQIKSLWNNLIGNAIKYNRAGGHVTITVQQDAGRLAVSVADTGIGIPPEALARIFSEFFRADNAKAVARPGTGLGLAIVKEIVERAGGQITAESELDKGSVFRFWLPACNEQQDANDAD